ncbi:MAG: hypothetical protein ACJ70V_07750, partial [Nitrososphaera sp.]
DRANMLQIVYLDITSTSSLRQLVSFIMNLYLDGRFDSLQLVCYDSKRVASFTNKLMIEEQEKFILYNKQFEP